MAFQAVPNRIEQDNLMGGYAPDALESQVPDGATPEALNILPRLDYPELREGFARLSAGRLSGQTGYWIRHVNYYEVIDSHTRKRYLMCVLTNGSNATASNVKIYAYDLVNNTFTRVDTPTTRAWARADTEHWYAVVEGTYYGGTRGELIYSWHPTNGWDADPTVPVADTWVDGTAPGAGEKARNFAFKKRDQVKYQTDYYKTTRSIRYDTWEDGAHYSVGDRVSRWASESGQTYWRSFRCIKKNTAAAATNGPGTGSDWATYWERVRLTNIKDSDGDITEDWVLNPVARKAAVGTYHGNRLFLRSEDEDNWSRIQYSSPAKPEANTDIADLDFNPTSWDPVDNFSGGGGGWFDVPFSGKGDAIRALYSFGNYLIICGRWQTFVLAGTNESTWTLRKLGEYGAVGPQAITELDGLVYMVGRHGYLTRTDGTQIEPVPGMEKIQMWLKDHLNDIIGTQDTNWYPTLVGHDRKLWLSLPVPAGSDNCTLVYDPISESFWKTDIKALDLTTGEVSGVSRLFFSTAINGTGSQTPTVFSLKDDAGSEIWTDDDWEGLSGSASTNDITWSYRTSWFQFGMARLQRRIRRVWALVSGEASSSVTVTTYRNFNPNTAVAAGTRTLRGTATYDAEFIEGKVGQSGTPAHSVSIKLNGTANDRVGLHGVGIDTERIRTRYKRGA